MSFIVRSFPVKTERRHRRCVDRRTGPEFAALCRQLVFGLVLPSRRDGNKGWEHVDLSRQQSAAVSSSQQFQGNSTVVTAAVHRTDSQ